MKSDTFSTRIGAVPAREAFQLTDIDVDLRNSLWNKILGFFDRGQHSEWDTAVRRLAEYFYKFPVDELPHEKYRKREWLKKRFYEAPWYGVYDLLEFLVQYYGLLPFAPGHSQESVRKTLNNVFEIEASGYRFIGNTLAPITSTVEIEAIDLARSSSRASGLAGAETHLTAAIRLISLKPVPDYRNCVKESISAVESVAKALSGESSPGLAGAIDELQKTVSIHGALRGAFLKLYGYTSDSDGIRHAILDKPTVGFDEAKYMLVACSAFVYYLISKTPRASIPG